MLHDISANHDDPIGASLRWCINFDETDALQLCLLALPQPLSALEGKPAFKRDTCPAIFLQRFELSTKMSSVARPRGAPQPVLFNDDPKSLFEKLQSSPSAYLRVEEGRLKLSIYRENHTLTYRKN
jgi:hypothetical protein